MFLVEVIGYKKFDCGCYFLVLVCSFRGSLSFWERRRCMCHGDTHLRYDLPFSSSEAIIPSLFPFQLIQRQDLEYCLCRATMALSS